MINKELEKLLNCDNCNLKECIGCDITYTDRKAIREYIEQLESNKQKIIEKLGEDVEQHTFSDIETDAIGSYAEELLEIVRRNE